MAASFQQMGGGAPAQSAPMTPNTTTANVMDIYQKMTVLEAGVQLVTSQLQQLEVTMGILQSKNEAQSVEMKDAIQVAFVQEKLEIQQIVTHAQDEFGKLRAMDTKTRPAVHIHDFQIGDEVDHHRHPSPRIRRDGKDRLQPWTLTG